MEGYIIVPRKYIKRISNILREEYNKWPQDHASFEEVLKSRSTYSKEKDRDVVIYLKNTVVPDKYYHFMGWDFMDKNIETYIKISMNSSSDTRLVDFRSV